MDVKFLKKEYIKKKAEIKKRLKEFKKNDDIFYELCFCLLTPQSNAYRCDHCATILKSKDFKNKGFDPKGILKGYTRFHNNKAKYLMEIKKAHPHILSELEKINDSRQKRDFLNKNVTGLGLKEASHFLRNIGYTNLAILDRHILKNLVRLNVIPELPKILTRKVYMDVELKFINFSKKTGIPMDELDLLFWSLETGKVFK